MTIHQKVNSLNKQQFFFKRIFDVSICIILLLFVIIILLLCCIIIFLGSGKTPFFFQKRVGLNEKIYTMFKLRTMKTSSKINEKNTITFFGNFLRRTKIDELPQIFNVIIGDMSLVGPRPEQVEIVENLNKKNTQYHLRHKVKPGITGLAQINNPVATVNDFEEKLLYDLAYINNYSIWLDIKILAKTFGIFKRF